METLPSYDYENKLKADGYSYIAGVDEAGRGPGAGPVVAAAVRVPDASLSTLEGKVKDSKKMTPRRRESMREVIINTCDYGIGVIDNKIIDEINILEATKIAMRKAIAGLEYVDHVLIDGNVKIKKLHLPQQQIIKGDNISISIAAASILAKTTRDELMAELHYVLPVYNWIKNKGYLTKEHIEMIRLYGASEYHRKSFRKVGK